MVSDFNYRVTTNDETTVYEGFNTNPVGSLFEIQVDSDLAVGPFYVHRRDEYLKAKSEIRRYLWENWNRNDLNIRIKRT